MESHEATFDPSIAARAPDPAPLPRKPKPTRAFDADALTRALRIAGAALVVAAASSFMLQNWQIGNDLTRYAMLVGQSLLLAAAAYFVGMSLREGRSARTFLALVLATMPISFAVLGGLVYSQFHLEDVATLPGYATWVAPDRLSAVLAVAATLIVLVPLAIVSFVALARKEARALTVAFFAANLLVLVPVRRPLAIVLLAGAALLTLLHLELTRFANSAQLDTPEGKLARAMPFTPPVVMLGRVLHLYHVDALFMGGVLLIGASGLWLLLARTAVPWKRDAGACLAAGFAATGWAMCFTELSRDVEAASAAVLVLGLPLSVIFALAAKRAMGSQRFLVVLASLTGLLTALVACAVDLNGIAAFGCIAVGVAVAVWGASMRALFRTASGSLVALYGLAVQVWLATHADSILRWVSLSVLGVLLIIGSAYVERNRSRVARFWARASNA
jgi:hypothetical protein